MIYLDNASTTKVDPRVLDAMMPFLTDQYGNPGSIHTIGKNALCALNRARIQVADFIGAEPDQIIFTSGGTEANNLAIIGVLHDSDIRSIAVSRVEHDSILRAIKRCNTGVNYIDVDSCCMVHPQLVRDVLKQNAGISSRGGIGFVSVMYVNNETGTINPVKQIADVCKEHGVLFHTDCVQAAGCQHIDVNEIGCDFLSISSHKIHGVKGVGALFVKDISKISPLICGGATQEFGLRGGTENVAGIVGFGKACEIAANEREEYKNTVLYYSKAFYEKLLNELRANNLDNLISINGSEQINCGKTMSIRVDGLDAETLVLMMDADGVCVSAGSACRSHESTPSHVLLAMGLTPEQARSSVRVSFSKFNTIEEIEKAACIMAGCIATLKSWWK